MGMIDPIKYQEKSLKKEGLVVGIGAGSLL